VQRATSPGSPARSPDAAHVARPGQPWWTDVGSDRGRGRKGRNASVQSRRAGGVTVSQIGRMVRCVFQALGLSGFATEDHSATWRDGWQNAPFGVEAGRGGADTRGRRPGIADGQPAQSVENDYGLDGMGGCLSQLRRSGTLLVSRRKSRQERGPFIEPRAASRTSQGLFSPNCRSRREHAPTCLPDASHQRQGGDRLMSLSRRVAKTRYCAPLRAAAPKQCPARPWRVRACGS